MSNQLGSYLAVIKVVGIGGGGTNAVTRMVEATFRRFGHLDVLVANAGILNQGRLAEMEVARWDEMMRTNLRGPFLCARAVLPGMLARRRGTILNVASAAGLAAPALWIPYAASKFGLEGWMESLRFEVEPFDIRTTIVEPGFFRTTLLEKESTTYAELSIDDYSGFVQQDKLWGVYKDEVIK